MGKKKTNAKESETIEIPGTEIKQTNRLYMAIREIGQCDGRGRSVLSLGYRGKIIAQPDRPLATMVWPLINELLQYVNYSGDDAALKDINQFKEIIASLRYGNGPGNRNGAEERPAKKTAKGRRTTI
jgi:hypothetical protein